MPGKTKLSSYCIVRDDEMLHQLIRFKMDQLGLTYHDIAEYLGVDQSNVRKYINKREHAISQQKVIALSLRLGINITLQVEIA